MSHRDVAFFFVNYLELHIKGEIYFMKKGDLNMKIKNLKVTNFKSCPDGVYGLSNINVLLGKNGKGKSSMQQALRYLLNGTLPEDPIRHGEDHLSVSALIDDGQDTEIGREYYLPDTYRINDENVKEKNFIQNVQKKKAECDIGHVQISPTDSSNKAFFSMEQDTLWEFFLTGKADGYRITGIKELEVAFADGTVFYARKSKPSKCTVNGKRVTAKALTEFLEDRLQGSVKALDITTSSEVLNGMEMPDFAKYLISVVPVTMDFEKLRELAGLTAEETKILRPLFPKAPAPITIADVTNVYKTLFEIRAVLNRQKNEWLQRGTYEGTLPLPDNNTVLDRLYAVNQELGAIKELEKSWVVYKKRVDERNRAIQTYTAWVKEYNSMGQVSYYDANALQEIQNSENITRQSIEQCVRNISSLRQSCNPLYKMVRNLDSKICPLCDRLTCNTDKTGCKTDIENNIRDIENNIKQTEEQQKIMERQLSEILERRDRMNEEVKKYENRRNLYLRIQELKKSIPEAPVEPKPVPSAEHLLNESKRYSMYAQQISVFNECCKAMDKYHNLKKMYELYCGLVLKAEPKKGLLTNTILDFLLQPFRDHVNGFIKNVFNDTEIRFEMGDDGLDVKCRPHGRTCFLPLKALSDGEKQLAVFTLMDMISTISGTRILVFDRMESMDEDAIDALFRTLLSDEVMERYDHIIVASVNHESIVTEVDQFHEAINIINF